MSQCGLLLVTTLFGTVSLQYISSGGSQRETALVPNPLDQYVVPYVNYFNLPPSRDFEGYNLPNTEDHIQFYKREDEQQSNVQRKRRTTDDGKPWEPNMLDKDKTAYYDAEKNLIPAIGIFNDVATKKDSEKENLIDEIVKRNFSPWGGKRTEAPIEQRWTWKRSTHVREPSMPKRVRFSPWGGKRSGQILYKTGMKGVKLIFATTMPELTRVVSNYSPSGEHYIAGLQIIPTQSKRHPIEILAVSSKMEGTVRDSMPFKSFLENLPKLFKPGHPYSNINLKKDGKRKLKFSAWGGKRSPPIIGPLWSPQDMKVSDLDAFLEVQKATEPAKSS